MSEASSRVLWRETKWKRRLRRYESLPVAQLVPEHRPLFVCQDCKFTNILIEICPWCKHPCSAQSPKIFVRKRVSSPQILNDSQKDQLQRIQARVDNLKAASLSSTVTAFDITMPHTTTETTTIGSRRRRHRNAMAHTIAISLDGDETDDDTGLVALPSWSMTTYAKTVADVRPSLSRSQTVKSTPTRLPPSPSRTLRRKKRISVIRQKSSCSLRRRAMLSLPITPSQRRLQNKNSNSHLPRKSSQARFSNPLPIATSPPQPNVPLGHPSRPLYSAIRKNMSRPSTPVRTSPTVLSPADLRARGMRSLDLPNSSREFVGDEYFSSDVTRRAWPVRPSSAGFSLSGEIELRMALERDDSDYVNIDAAAAPSDSGYKFAGKKDLDANLKHKVKRFGKGLKDLVMMRI